VESASLWRIPAVCAMFFLKQAWFFLIFCSIKGKMNVVTVVCHRKEEADD